MKIRVISLKDIIKYSIKTIIIFGIIAVLVNVFNGIHSIPNPNSISVSKLLPILKGEILLAKNHSDNNKINFSKSDYILGTLNSEFSMFTDAPNKDSNSNIPTSKIISTSAEQEIPTENNEAITENSTEPNFQGNDIIEAQVGLPTEVQASNVPDKTSCQIFGVNIRDECDYNLEKEITDLNTSFSKQNILIFHTHTCESYTQTPQYKYAESGNYRTTDLNYSVSRVGDELEKYLTHYGYSVVHNKSYHDYPSYNGSYNRSLVTVENLLDTYSDTDVVIDLHRDAIGDNTYAPKIKIGDEYCARIMFVIGTDGGGQTHKNWRENLKFAIKVVQKGNELYPGLFKPIIVRNSRYNHQVAKAACIIEVGATGNTLEECLNSMKYLARIYNEF